LRSDTIRWRSRSASATSANAHYHILAIAGWCHQLAGEHGKAQSYVARLQVLRPGYSREDYLRAFPFSPKTRAVIDEALAELGVGARGPPLATPVSESCAPRSAQ
jgi:hypothetical protein